MIDLIVFYVGVVAILGLRPWSMAHRLAPHFDEKGLPDEASLQERYARRYRLRAWARPLPLILLVYFLFRYFTVPNRDLGVDSFVPGLLAVLGFVLINFLGALLWRYGRDRAFASRFPAFRDSVQPLGLRLLGFFTVFASVSSFAGALLVPSEEVRGLLIALGGLILAIGRRLTMRAVVRSQVHVPNDSEMGGLISQTVAQFGFTPRAIILVPSTIANAYAMPDGTVMITTALRSLVSDEEVAAITAHELSHVRDGDARRIQRYQMWTMLVLVVTVMGIAFWLALHDGCGLYILPVCLCVPVALWQAIHRWTTQKTRQMEFKCDADTAKIGYAAPLSNALTTVYRYMGLPRHWIGMDVKSLSHPSLDERLERLGAF